MAFSGYGSPMGSPSVGVGGGVQNGPDLEDIQTEGLGFLAISGEDKLQLLPTKWPAEKLPPTHASLLSVASRKGLVAAAGPDGVVLAYTKSVRKAFEGKETVGSNLKSFQPESRIPISMRISQLAFSADETYLVLSAEEGGGLAVYEVDSLLNGGIQSAFEISTNNESLRALIPNPTPEKGELFAVVTTNGNLMMANLKERSFVQGQNGLVLKSGVSCVSWSARGKQLVAGLGDGTAYQVTPEGVGKGDIPKPPDMNNGEYVGSITWLENNVFLIVHTAQNGNGSFAPESAFHIVTRTPPSGFVFQKISDPAEPFCELARAPPHHFTLRLRNFPPNLDDILIVASTASIDIGLLTKSKTPLSNEKPADKVTGVFTKTAMSDDSRRAQLPMTSTCMDTSPIGLALDLSSTDKVWKPIPADEIDESPSPLPAFLVLNNEGVLAMWWVVYSESIRQGTTYPGLAVSGGTVAVQASPALAKPPFGATSSPAPALGQNTFGSAPAAPAFGSPGFSKPIAPAIGSFGSASGLGQKSSPWGTTSNTAPSGSTFGQVAVFGSASTLGGGGAFGRPAFGAAASPAFGASPWPTGSTAPVAAFGQAGGIKSVSIYGASPATGNQAPASGAFSAFVNSGGFAAAATLPNATSESLFSKPAASIFDNTSQAENKPPTGLFGSNSQNEPTKSIFGSAAQSTPTASLFGGSGKFTLGTTFKADPDQKDEPLENDEPKSSSFVSGFGNLLGGVDQKPAVEAPISKEADMDAEEDIKPPVKDSTTPASTPAPAKFQFPSTTPSNGDGNSLFGSTASQSTTPAIPPNSSTGFPFGKPAPGDFSFASLEKTELLAPKALDISEPPPITETPAIPYIKNEPDFEENTRISDSIPEAPLQPDSNSKSSFFVGHSSPSSAKADEPLSSDFPAKTTEPKTMNLPPPSAPESPKPIRADFIPPMDVPSGSEDDGDGESGFSSDEDAQSPTGEEGTGEEGSEEGSGEDVAKDLSPEASPTVSIGFTPQSSFGGLNARVGESSIFQVPKPSQMNAARSLFGEGIQAPSLPPPKLPESPRSPSPVRNAIPPRMQRPDTSRSVSAPGAASQLLGSSQRLGSKQPAKPIGPSPTFILTREEQKADEKRRAEAKAQKEAEESRELIDIDDERMRDELENDIMPTTILHEFEAHSDYVAGADVHSVPAQVEAVYRDINSMIDTLGINARNLESFIQGHSTLYKERGREKDDLEIPDDWCLVEIDNLAKIVEVDLTKELHEGRVKDASSKLEACIDLEKEISKLKAKSHDVQKIVDAQRDPDKITTARMQPLSAEQATQQHDLRRDFKQFQILLSEAEGSLTLLKTKLVTQGSSKGPVGPTVEAVMRTITKMTSMAEKRSGDIDVLEKQMRRLQFSSTDGPVCRKNSPFTPRQSLRNSTLFYTPESTSRNHLQNSLRSSINGSPAARKKLSGYSNEEKKELKEKLAKRKDVLNKLKTALDKAGPTIRLMSDDY